MSPKFVVVLDPKRLKVDSFAYNEPGPVPPFVRPDDPDEPRDGAPPDEPDRDDPARRPS